METYKEFLNRINAFEKVEPCFGVGAFKVNSSLKNKVNEDASFKEFYGDTIVFDLEVCVKNRISAIIDMLYLEVPESFAEKLRPETLHMTLHDMSNASEYSVVEAEMVENREKIIKIYQQMSLSRTIRMRSKCIFNMVNTSLVLGLYPVNEEEYTKLMELYDIFDELKQLPYPLTPHITLAYYKVEGFGQESAGKLEKLVAKLNQQEEFEILLDTKRLLYQWFRNMNAYENVLYCNEREVSYYGNQMLYEKG